MTESTGQISDGYHTFDELYAHRHHLFTALMLSNPSISWVAKKHDDGTMFDGYFIAGMNLPTGPITYHMPISMWEIFTRIEFNTNEFAPKWDGHTSEDALERLKNWCWNIGQE